MIRHKLFLYLFILAAPVLWLTGCSDEDSVAPTEEFAIDITVLDAAGQPLADRSVIVMPLLPPGVLQDDLQAAMPSAVQIPFQVPDPCLVDLEIRDVAGATVRMLLSGDEAPAGQHTVVWNGQDDAEVDRYTGWYAAVLTCRDATTGEVLFTDARDMLMATVDFDRTEFRTDSDGKLTITDRRVVPGFWDVPEMRFTDENGNLTGLHTFTRWTQIRAAGDRVEFEAVDGRQSYTLQQPTLNLDAPAGATAAAITSSLVDVPPVDGEFELGNPRPNPFN